MKRILFSAILIAGFITVSLAQPCLPEGITFTTQEEIDYFQTNYPDCTEIEGRVTINGDDITNLNGLSVIIHMEENLEIYSNESLTNITGLENLESIGGDLMIGYHNTPRVPSFANPSLISLAGLDNLISIGGNFIIANNHALVSLGGLTNLISVGGSLCIGLRCGSWSGGNESLTDISTLVNLTSIGGWLAIDGNPALENISGIKNIDPVSINELSICGNTSLSACEVQSICDFLAGSNTNLTIITGNAPGCNSPEEVEKACFTNLPELSFDVSFTISPNPITGSVNLQFTIAEQGLTICNFYTVTGIRIKQLLYEENIPGTYEKEIELGDLPKGVYFCVLKTTDGIQTRKIVKL